MIHRSAVFGAVMTSALAVGGHSPSAEPAPATQPGVSERRLTLPPAEPTPETAAAHRGPSTKPSTTAQPGLEKLPIDRAVTEELEATPRGLIVGDVSHASPEVRLMTADLLRSVAKSSPGRQLVFAVEDDVRDQARLDRFMQTGDEALIPAYLGNGGNPENRAAEITLYNTARELGYRIVAIDSDTVGRDGDLPAAIGERVARSNPQMIENLARLTGDASRVVALIGDGHVHTPNDLNEALQLGYVRPDISGNVIAPYLGKKREGTIIAGGVLYSRSKEAPDLQIVVPEKQSLREFEKLTVAVRGKFSEARSREEISSALNQVYSQVMGATFPAQGPARDQVTENLIDAVAKLDEGDKAGSRRALAELDQLLSQAPGELVASDLSLALTRLGVREGITAIDRVSPTSRPNR